MNHTFSYEFEELPLVIHNGIEAAFINGRAGIDYTSDGEWQVTGASVEGFGERVDGKRQWPYVPAPAALEDMICHRLENEWFSKVSAAISEQLASDREDAAEQRAEMRRDALMGL